MIQVWVIIAMLGRTPVVVINGFPTEAICLEKAKIMSSSKFPQADLLNQIGVEYKCAEERPWPRKQ